MAFSLLAAEEGFLDSVDVDKVVDYDLALHQYLDSDHADLIAKIDDDGKFEDETKAKMKEALSAFAKQSAF
ncbi:F0F1 ATP synthase subunit alpha, partial [bacterium]|nr:F0F1 ATP synthase subunit alpha [bacterium]